MEIPTLEQACEMFIDYSRHQCCESTIRVYSLIIKSMRRYWDHVGIWDKPFTVALSTEHSRSLWMHYIQNRNRISTIAEYYKLLNRIRTHMVNKRFIEFDEHRLTHPGQVPIKAKPSAPHEPYTEAEYKRVLYEADGDWKIIIQIGWETGLRFGDIVDLRAEEVCIDGENKHLKITPKKTRRLGKTVEAPISDNMARKLAEIMDEDELEGDDCFFPEMAVNYAKGYRYDSEFLKIAKEAKIHKGFHSLRRAVISRLVQAGHDSAMIMAITGQSPTAMQAYVRIPIGDKRKIMGFDQS